MCDYLGAEWWNLKDLKEQRVKNKHHLSRPCPKMRCYVVGKAVYELVLPVVINTPKS